MALYHLNITPISRRAGRSIAQVATYITGQPLHDSREDRVYERARTDVLYARIFTPAEAPEKFFQLQSLIDAIDQAEKRKDSRTAREIVAALPNELSRKEWKQVVDQFIAENITRHELCAIAAIHSGMKSHDPMRSNPHTHILISTRTVGPEGFSDRKDREHDRLDYLIQCRESWARIQNAAYERAGFDIRVDCRSFRDRGLDREATRHLNRIECEREQCGERTLTGNYNRAIKARNEERERQMERRREWSLERSR